MLNDEDKARIQAEEEFRAKSRVKAEKKAKRRGLPWWGWALIVVGGLYAIGANAPRNKTTPLSTRTPISPPKTQPAPVVVQKPKPKPKPALELLAGDEGYADDFSVKIDGRIRNNSNDEYSYVQVQFNIYDKAGNQIGNALANAANLEPGSVWKFQAFGAVKASDGWSYRLKDITKF